MMPRGAPYISWADLGVAMASTLVPDDPTRVQLRIEAFWAAQTVACLSVRSGFDAVLQVLAYPPGSEVIVSAITIPHILEILSHHRLRAVPVDLDMDTLAVDAADVARAITADTRAILVTHLFGGRNPIDDIVALAHEHALLLFEDCAQAYDGRYRGHPAADVRMFSFGPIKRQTALGGALLTFREAGMADRVRQLQTTYPQQPRRSYAKRIVTMAAIKAVTWKPFFSVFATLCQWLHFNHDALLGTALRSFGGGDLIARLRWRPGAPLLHLLDRRLRQSADAAIAKRNAIVDGVRSAWTGLPGPGRSMPHRSSWLFPIHSSAPEQLVQYLWRHGFDATRGASNLICAPAADGHPAPKHAAQFMKDVVYLPLGLPASPATLRRMAGVLRQWTAGTAAGRPLIEKSPTSAYRSLNTP